MIPKLEIMKEKSWTLWLCTSWKYLNKKDTIKVCLTYNWIFWSQRLNCKRHQANRQYLILPWTWLSHFLKLLSYVFCPTETFVISSLHWHHATDMASKAVKVSWSTSICFTKYYLSQSGVTQFAELLTILWSFQSEGGKTSCQFICYPNVQSCN